MAIMVPKVARKILSLRFREKLLLAALGPLVPALLASVLGLLALIGTVRAHGEAYEASRRLEKVRVLDSFIVDAESYARGYLNTGAMTHLQAYSAAAVQVPAILGELRVDLAPGSRRALDLVEIGRQFASWRTEVIEPWIRSRGEAGFEAAGDADARDSRLGAIDLPVRERSRVLIEGLRGLVVRFERHEMDQIRKGVEHSQQARSMTLLAAIAGLAFAVTLGLWTAWLISRRTGRELSDLAAVAGAIADGDLSRRAREQGSAEIVEVGRFFNRMAERLVQRRHERTQLQELAGLLQASSTAEEAGEVAKRFAPEILPGGSGGLFLIEESRIAAHRLFGFGAEDVGADFAYGDCWAIRRAHEHVVRRAQDPPCAHVEREDLALSLCLPLETQGETFGVFHFRLAHANAIGLDLDDCVASAQTFASELSLSFATLRLVDRLRQQSIRDPLTGLYNRRYFDETLERELARARRSNKPLSLVMVDLDHFKRFNDMFGHEAGDLVLKEVGTLMRQLFRNVDVACRLGGEELAIILPDAEPHQVRPRVEELAMRLRNRDLKLRKQPLGRVTLSAGISSFPDHGATMSDLMRSADEALYGAKSAGRDRLQLAS
jgi:diguanylate cyclase (GGDEF)-like protein